MKTTFHSITKYRVITSLFIFLLVSTAINTQAQTTCTNNPASCVGAILDPNAAFLGGSLTSVSTAGVGVNPVFTLNQLSNTTNLTVTSGQYYVTTDNCVLVSFTEVRVGLNSAGPTSVSIILPDATVITCAGVTVDATTGAVCIQICDPRIDVGQLIRVQLSFDVTTGDFNNKSVIVSAFALLNLAANTTCTSGVICLTDQNTCTTPCNPSFPIAVGKIRVFFTTPIPIGVPTPTVNAASTVIMGVVTPLTQFNLCLTADAGTTVVRTYADYCVYSNLPLEILPVTNLILTLQSGILPSVNCPISLVPVLCPTGFSPITDTRTCPPPCDPAFPTLAGKVRIFFPTTIPAGMPDPIVSEVSGIGVTLGTVRLCALANAGTNVARTYADYCVYTNLGSTFTLPILNALSFTIQSSSCGLPQICIVNPVTTPACLFTTFVVIDNGSGGGVGGGLGTCATTSTCSGSTAYLASRLRVNLSTCLPAGIPAPTLTSFQTVHADGSVSLLNEEYCIVVSDESAAQIATERCFIEYCVYAKVNGNTFFVNPPVTLLFNHQITANLGGQNTPITVSCPGNIGSGPTPVTILNFDYQLKNCGVALRWSTAQETNSKEFVVQNSNDGITWSDVGKVRAQGLSGVKKDYNFIHPNPVNGQNFYRFAAVDLDGTTKYSEVLSPKINCGKAEISVHPNPFTDLVNVYFTSLKNGNVTISLRDNTGRTLFSNNRTVQSGSNTITLDNLSKLPKGVYIISVKTDDGIINQKLVK